MSACSTQALFMKPSNARCGSLRRTPTTWAGSVATVLVVLAYTALALSAALYGSAVCVSPERACVDVLLEFQTFPGVYVTLTAANVIAAGLAGGLIAILGLAVFARVPTSGPEGAPADK